MRREYHSLELLRRSGSISLPRYEAAIEGRKMSPDQLREEAGRLIGKNPAALRDKRLPGCAMLDD